MQPSTLTLVKTYRYLLILALVLFSYNTVYAQEKHVYVTDTGSKYHKESCRYLKYSKTKMTLDSAAIAGYGACKVCRPPLVDHQPSSDQKTQIKTAPAPNDKKPASTYTSATRCSATTQKGTRCKRTTRSGSGKCWQHE